MKWEKKKKKKENLGIFSAIINFGLALATNGYLGGKWG